MSDVERAIARFYRLAEADPEGRSLGYHRALVTKVRELAPDAGVALVLAAACQHLERWTLPRDRFPADVLGYKRWRSELARFHARRAAEELAALGFAPETIARVGELLQKKRLGTDPEVQLFEDAICLVFAERELPAFAAKHPPEKVRVILDKTLAKMSDDGRARLSASLARQA